jgi:hypothetical protein
VLLLGADGACSCGGREALSLEEPPAMEEEGIGTAIDIFEKAREFFTGGGIIAEGFTGSYTPNPRPAKIQPTKCVRWLRLHRDASLSPLPQVPGNAFGTVPIIAALFKLELTYDGKNLLSVKLLPQQAASAAGPLSTLDIKFRGEVVPPEYDPIAHITIQIIGTYEVKGIMSNDKYSVDGELHVRGDGSTSSWIDCEDNMIQADPLFPVCPILKV